ncbi:MAG: Hly-III family protein, partial [Silicimonas sp.]|nr:Hly-III family protein [Silicimonas sp.]
MSYIFPMPAVLAKRIAYTRAEYFSDLIVHLTGVVAVAAAVPVLVMLAILLDGTSAQVIATLVYGFGLVAMIGCSAVYNIFPHPEWEWLFRRLDHSAIYLKIAGTYTAFVLIAGHGFALAAG